MGPEEVLIQGKNVSVNGKLVPDGESQLLHGTIGSGRLPSASLFLGTACLALRAGGCKRGS